MWRRAGDAHVDADLLAELAGLAETGGSTSDTTVPDAPARAVRPERWTYAAASAGGS